MSATFQHQQLSNGLNVIAEVDDRAHTAAVGFFVKTGARDEDRAVMGVSHYLEHMMFKSTAAGRSAEDVNREFDEIGASFNAYTSQENTVYYARVLPEYLTKAVDLFTDMLRPALGTDDFDMEKNVILEEIGMYDDRPHWRLHDALLEEYFGDHPLSYRVLGTNDTIARLSSNQMRDYFQQRYSPDNITVAAAGRLDFAQLVDDVSRRAGAWQPTGAVRQYDDPPAAAATCSQRDKKLNRHYVAAITPGPDAQDERRYAAAVLAQVLGDEDGSRLYWALIEPGLCDEADFAHHSMDQAGYYVVYASCAPDRAEQVERILLETIDGYVNDIDPTEIERAKNKLATEATLHGENTGGRMRSLGGQWTYLGTYTPLEEEVAKIMAIGVDEVRRLIEARPFTPRTVARLGPE